MFKNLRKKKLRQIFFAWKTANYLTSIHFLELPKVIDSDSENLAHTPEEGYQPFTDGNVRTYKDGDLYAIYYDRVRIVISNNKEKLVKVSILGQGEEWKIWELDAKGKNIHTIDSPGTMAYTVYTYCDVLMPTGRMISDERYTTGTWNEYVYNAVETMVEYVYSFKERNKFNNYYNC
jgi:hypothetical protein